jgi:GNAT superfamily N-acetyltransferase
MEFKQEKISAQGIKLSVEIEGKGAARAYLYIMHNDLHQKPFGLLEDVFVDESLRGQGIGTELINKIIEEAKRNDCYKIVATSRNSRPRVHELYERLGFEKWGVEFRMNI